MPMPGARNKCCLSGPVCSSPPSTSRSNRVPARRFNPTISLTRAVPVSFIDPDLGRTRRSRARTSRTSSPRFTTDPGRITRPVLTPAMATAREQVRAWMHEAGLETREDALGNLAGRRGEAPLVIGSHLDSVADAGRYDGILGILVGLELAETTDVPLEVVAFADEDGLRFGSLYLGSRAFVGEPIDLSVSDAHGVTLGDALAGELGPPLFDPATRAYLEVHIEQGPVLEAEGFPLGVVTAIAGQSRFKLVFAGRAGHAGTVPMDLRHDARGRRRRVRARRRARRARRAGPGRDRRRAADPQRRRQRDPGPRRGDARAPPRRRRRPRPCGRRAARRDRRDRRAPRRAGDVVDGPRAARDPLHARRPDGRGRREDRRGGARAPERRRPRRRHDGRA